MPTHTTRQPTPVFEVTYEDYLRTLPENESGGPGTPVFSRADWNAFSPPERFSAVGGRLVITPDDPRFEALNVRVGDPNEPNRNIVVAIGDPDEAYRPDWIRDPGRIERGDGWYAISDTNLTSDYGRAQETRSRRMQQRAAIAAVAVLTSGLAYAALAGGSAAGAAGGAAVTAEGAAGIGMGATGAGAVDLAGAAGAAGAVAAPAAGATGSAAPSFANVAGGASTTAPTGIIGSVTNALGQIPAYYNSLSPAGRLLVNTAVSSGAQALSGASAQRNAQQAATERENREREDRTRRGSVPAFTNPYTPRPTGIIGSALTPRPGGG